MQVPWPGAPALPRWRRSSCASTSFMWRRFDSAVSSSTVARVRIVSSAFTRSSFCAFRRARSLVASPVSTVTAIEQPAMITKVTDSTSGG